jgi:hypothetical protein
MEPKIIRVYVGRKTYSFSIPDQADNFFSPNEGNGLAINKNNLPVMVFNKWDRLEVVYDDGAVV